MRQNKIRCSVLCLTAEIYVCRRAAELTHGNYCVILDEMHLSEALRSQVSPPADLKGTRALATDFIYMGFPKRSFESIPFFAFDANDTILSTATYICPRCNSRVSSIPTTCTICALPLNSSSHIARSHHHLFPVQHFKEVEDAAMCVCQACFEPILSVKFCCEKCNSNFCGECDLVIHTSLHNCPNCCLL